MEMEQKISEELRAFLHSVICESAFIDQLSSVWSDIGLSGESLKGRRETMHQHIDELLQLMLNEEVSLQAKLKESIANNSLELAKLCQQLSLPNEKPQPDEGAGLHETEKAIRDKVDSLNKLKFDRIKRLRRLMEMEAAMCKSIGEPQQKHKAECVPSEEDLQTLRTRIEKLEETKDQRQNEFFATRTKILRVWEELEIEPDGAFGTLVAEGDTKKFIFSLANMAALNDFYQEIESEAAALEGKALRLRDSISSLWNRLEVPAADRTLFTDTHVGFKPKTIAILEQEVKRLNVLKQENMARFVQGTRKELNMMWDLCSYGPQQRREFLPAFSDEIDEDVLSAHESELDRIRGFYADNKDVFVLVAKREDLWTKFTALEQKTTDPDRFKNRGGQMLKDTNAKKQVHKDLHKIEKELRATLGPWEEDHERYFLVDDARYLDTIQDQWEERSSSKEKEKIKRQREKEETLMLEMQFGSKPCTPVKQKKRAAASPLTAPAKMRKIAESPLVVRATNTVAARPPNGRADRRRMASKTPVRPPQKRVGRGNRRILGDRNATTTITSGTEESFISQIDSSVASTAGSYTDFHSDLMQGILKAKNARSSAIPKSSSMNSLV